MAEPGPEGLRDRIQLAHCLKEGGDFVGAEAAYRQAAADAPVDADANRQLGLFLRRQERGEAFDWLARAALIDPADRETREALAESELDSARADRRLIVALLRGGEGPAREEAGSWLDRALALLSPPRPAAEGAHVAWRRAATLEPAAGRAWVAAQLAAEPGEEVLRACRVALLHTPRAPMLHLFHAQVLAALKRSEAAAQSALAAWRLRPGWEPAAAQLAELGWSATERDAVARRSWEALPPGGAEAARVPPRALTGRARTIWMHLAAAIDERRAA